MEAPSIPQLINQISNPKWKHETYIPPAARLTIRTPGILTSTGYGIPAPLTSLGSSRTPSLPFRFSLQASD